MANVSGRRPREIADDIASRVLRHERGIVTEQDRRIQACAPGLAEATAQLSAMPGVGVAAATASRGFLAKIAALRVALGQLDVDGEAMSEVRELLSMLREPALELNMLTLGL